MINLCITLLLNPFPLHFKPIWVIILCYGGRECFIMQQALKCVTNSHAYIFYPFYFYLSVCVHVHTFEEFLMCQTEDQLL